MKFNNCSASVVLNTPASHRQIKKFKGAFPDASFYGSMTLGSKRKSYFLPVPIYVERLEELKRLKMSTAREQPFVKKESVTVLKSDL